MNKFEKDFKEWFESEVCQSVENRPPILDLIGFVGLPFSMQWGVYLAFFDSVGIKIYTMPSFYPNGDILFFGMLLFEETEDFKTREQAQREAIKKAKLIYEGL